MKRVSILFLLIFNISFIFADSNGVWHYVEDLRGEVFGGDEQNEITNFTFINDVYFNENIFTNKNVNLGGGSLFINSISKRVGIKNINPQVELDVNGSINAKNITKDGLEVATIDEVVNLVNSTIQNFSSNSNKLYLCPVVKDVATHISNSNCLVQLQVNKEICTYNLCVRRYAISSGS